MSTNSSDSLIFSKEDIEKFLKGDYFEVYRILRIS